MSSLWLTHLFNAIIRTKKYPKILKVTRVLPILKSKKPKTAKNLYRPVANLSVFDKVIQELIKRQLGKYFDENELLLMNHNGGKKLHSTLSARAVIDAECSEVVEENKLGLVLSTDLSAALDTVDKKNL